MATSTFTKKIVLSKEAAKRLAREIDGGRVPPKPKVNFQIMTKEELDVWAKKEQSK